jgi:hypothetical protein
MIYVESDIEDFKKTIDRFKDDPYFQMNVIQQRIEWLVKINSHQDTLKERRSSKMLIDAYVELFSQIYFRQQLQYTDNP